MYFRANGRSRTQDIVTTVESVTRELDNTRVKSSSSPKATPQVTEQRGSQWTPVVEAGGLTVTINESALAIPKADQVISITNFIPPTVEAICIEAASFPQGQPILAKEFLNEELERLQRNYEEQLDQIEAAKTANNIIKWAIGGAATVASIIATPAAGALISGIGGIATQGASIVIEELEKAMQRGDVSEDFLDQIGYVAKDQYYIDKYVEKFQRKSKSQLKYLISKTYKAYESILNIPVVYAEKLDQMVGRLPQFENKDWEEHIETGRVFIAKRNQTEIILSVLCSLYEGQSSSPSLDQGGKPSNGSGSDSDEKEGNGKLKALAASALITIVGAYLL